MTFFLMQNEVFLMYIILCSLVIKVFLNTLFSDKIMYSRTPCIVKISELPINGEIEVVPSSDDLLLNLLVFQVLNILSVNLG